MPKNIATRLDKVDKVMIIAHPDDEMLFFSQRLMAEQGWLVVCCTNGDSPSRAESFRKVARLLEFRTLMWDYPDGNELVWDKEKAARPIRNVIQSKAWTAVLTHNREGEYGHLQHRQVHDLVIGCCDHRKLEVPVSETMLEREANRLPATILSRKRDIIGTCYRSEKSRLDRLEKFFAYEKLVAPEA